MVRRRNLVLPGNPRYQPQSMIPYFGYDNLSRWWIKMEIALLKALAIIGYLPKDAADQLYLLLTKGIEEQLCQKIPMTRVDFWEKQAKKKTRHDVRSLVHCIQAYLPIPLRWWVHIVATSFDIRDPGAILAFRSAYQEVTRPTIKKVGLALADKAERLADTLQIGRTHGQHALPITVGFWLATILHRLITCAQYLKEDACRLRGKFSGAVGAYNAQEGLKVEACYQSWRKKQPKKMPPTFEEFVLWLVKLEAEDVSTQILPPEALGRFLHSYVQLSAVLGQLGRDGRNLQRSEIAEISEGVDPNQVFSSTMASKRNPITFENLEGVSIVVKDEFHKVMDTNISEHQRDLTGSAVMREFPGIVVLTQYQLETAARLIPKMVVNSEALQRNFQLSAHLVLSEPLYIALIIGGFKGDAHHLVNHVLTPLSQASGMSLVVELEKLAHRRHSLRKVIGSIPPEIWELLYHPEQYIGRAPDKTREIVKKARKVLSKF